MIDSNNNEGRQASSIEGGWVLERKKSSLLTDYYELTKPRVVLLMILTAIVGMCLAAPGRIAWHILICANLGIALGAASAAVINQVVDYQIDCLMKRTQRRPIVQGKVTITQALIFSGVLCLASMLLLVLFVNLLVAVLTFLTLVAYAVFYTMFLKRATSQNIVIGGIAGAAPPLLGWVAVTGHVDPQALLLVLIIFVWTPPHFWALAIARVEEYAKAKIPMLPNTLGVAFTKLSVLLYTILLFGVTLLPFVVAMSGWIYLASVFLLNLRFLYWAIRLMGSENPKVPMLMFRYSISYLMLLFVALLADHYYLVHFMS